MEELLESTKVHAPFLTELIVHADKENPSCNASQKFHQCHSKLTKFFQCIASASPTCALVPPTESAMDLLRQLCDKDISSNPDVGFTILKFSILIMFFQYLAR